MLEVWLFCKRQPDISVLRQHGAEMADPCTGNVPPKANLGDLRGLSGGVKAGGSVMIDGGDFDGAKAYKDSKVLDQ